MNFYWSVLGKFIGSQEQGLEKFYYYLEKKSREFLGKKFNRIFKAFFSEKSRKFLGKTLSKFFSKKSREFFVKNTREFLE